MGVLAVSWAFRQRISGNDKVVLLAIADHANDDGECWPSVPLIAEKACVSERTVQRILIKLEAENFVKRIARSGEYGRKASNLYVLAMENCYGDKVSPIQDDGDNSVTGDGDNSVTGDGDNCVTTLKGTIIKNHHKELSSILPGFDLEAEFKEFWAAYPKRPGNPKHKAFVQYVYARKTLKVSKEEIFNGLNGYARLCEGKEAKFIKWAVNWLKDRRWQDDYPLDGGADRQTQLASDADFDALVKEFPGQVGNAEAVKKLMAEKFAKGATLDALCEAARKYRLFCKGPPYEDRRIMPSPLDKWLRFKWQEMDAYEVCYVGPDRIKTVRQKKGLV